MERLDILKKDIADYWSDRASTYAEDGHERNRELWKQDFVKHIKEHYPDRHPEEDMEFENGLGKTEQQGGSQFLVKAVKRR